jgi:hypothetical protein
VAFKTHFLQTFIQLSILFDIAGFHLRGSGYPALLCFRPACAGSINH